MYKIKTFVFVALFCILLAFFSWFFRPPQDGSSIIHYETPNTIDVLFVGSSHIHCGVNPNVIWNEEGISAFNFSSRVQPIWISYNYIIEALKTQKPFVVVLDVLTTSIDIENGYQESYQDIYSTFPLSYNKIDMIKTGVKPGQRITMTFDILSFHTRWKNISKESQPYKKQEYMRKNPYRYKGYRWYYMFQTMENLSGGENDIAYPATNEQGEIPDKNLLYLLRIIELSKEREFELLLIKTPSLGSIKSGNEQGVYNSIRKIAEENQISFIDYNENRYREAMGIDFRADLFDYGHLNAYGAAKFSKYIASQLKAKYELTDRRGDRKYESWNESANGYFYTEALEKAKMVADLPSYLEAVKDVNKNLIFITSVNGGMSEMIKPFKEQFPIIGIETDVIGQNSYISIYEPSSGYQYEDISATRELRKNIYKDNIPISIDAVSAGSKVGSIASIKIDGKEHAKNKRGLNIVIYDKEMERVFDSFYVDTFANADEALAIKR